LGVDPRTVRRYYHRWGGIEVVPGTVRFFEKRIVEVLNAEFDKQTRAQEVYREGVGGWCAGSAKAVPGCQQKELSRRNRLGKQRARKTQAEIAADPHGIFDDQVLGHATADKNGVVLTGAFFIGPKDFYDTLNHMPEEEQNQFEMTGVEVANQLYGNETLRALQRKEGRFCNTGMKATVLGHVSSDMLEDGTVISGVGGQYNFVSTDDRLRPEGPQGQGRRSRCSEISGNHERTAH
jgi:hypothetical protein